MDVRYLFQCYKLNLRNAPTLIGGIVFDICRMSTTVYNAVFITFRGESWTTRNVLWSCASVCLSVCLSVRGRMPTLLRGPGCSLGSGGDAPSCAVLGGFAIGARVIALLWQHYGNSEPSGNPPGPPHAARMPHTHATHAGEDSPRRR